MNMKDIVEDFTDSSFANLLTSSVSVINHGAIGKWQLYILLSHRRIPATKSNRNKYNKATICWINCPFDVF